MTTICLHASSDRLTLYFYGELPLQERVAFELHVASCETCAGALAELRLIRDALADREAAAGSRANWGGFMDRLQSRLDHEPHAPRRDHVPSPAFPIAGSRTRRVAVAWIPVAAALLMGVALGLVWQRRALDPARTQATAAPAGDTALAAAAAGHFERAKLVVLGLAMKDPASTGPADWEHERELAASLLPATRLFRMSALDRGDARLADLLGDLESVLLQASMASDAGAPDLQRIQRVIRRRDLLVRMDLREL